MLVVPAHKIGECEVCNGKGIVVRSRYQGIWFCDPCYTKEQTELANHLEPVKQAERVARMDELHKAVTESEKIDSSIQVRTDLFNAATTAIVELKASIDVDTTITNKPYALAEKLMARFSHFKQVVFELNQKIVEAGNQQKAIQVYLNQLANSLRADEREKLRLADISYKPSAPKIAKVSAVKTAVKKLDKVELRKYASELGISEFTLQMIVVQKGISVEDAAKLLRRSINEAKSE
jgi:ribosomal protein L37AE/L43A